MRIALYLLQTFISEPVVGDLIEEYRTTVLPNRGRWRGAVWLWSQALRSIMSLAWEQMRTAPGWTLTAALVGYVVVASLIMASFAVSEVIAPGRHEGIVLVLREVLGGFAASMLGGWTASWIARGGVLSGGTALAGFCLMMAIVSLDLSGGLAHHLMLVTVMVSGVLAGCLVRARQSRPAQ